MPLGRRVAAPTLLLPGYQFNSHAQAYRLANEITIIVHIEIHTIDLAPAMQQDAGRPFVLAAILWMNIHLEENRLRYSAQGEVTVNMTLCVTLPVRRVSDKQDVGIVASVHEFMARHQRQQCVVLCLQTGRVDEQQGLSVLCRDRGKYKTADDVAEFTSKFLGREMAYAETHLRCTRVDPVKAPAAGRITHDFQQFRVHPAAFKRAAGPSRQGGCRYQYGCNKKRDSEQANHATASGCPVKRAATDAVMLTCQHDAWRISY